MKLLTTTFLLLSSSIVYANETIDNGKELFNTTNCVECHATSQFKYRKNKVHNFTKLHKIVNACAVESGAPWFDDDIMDVSSYLNHKYYQFKKDKN